MPMIPGLTLKWARFTVGTIVVGLYIFSRIRHGNISCGGIMAGGVENIVLDWKYAIPKILSDKYKK